MSSVNGSQFESVAFPFRNILLQVTGFLSLRLVGVGTSDFKRRCMSSFLFGFSKGS